MQSHLCKHSAEHLANICQKCFPPLLLAACRVYFSMLPFSVSSGIKLREALSHWWGPAKPELPTDLMLKWVCRECCSGLKEIKRRKTTNDWGKSLRGSNYGFSLTLHLLFEVFCKPYLADLYIYSWLFFVLYVSVFVFSVICTWLGMARYHHFGFGTIPSVSILNRYHRWKITSLKK